MWDPAQMGWVVLAVVVVVLLCAVAAALAATWGFGGSSAVRRPAVRGSPALYADEGVSTDPRQRVVTLIVLGIMVIFGLHLALQYSTSRCGDALARREYELPSARLEADIQWYCFFSGGG